MREDEYKQLTRALEDQLEADIELIRAGYRAKRHALDMLWQAASAAGEPNATSGTLSPATQEEVRRETQPIAETQSPVETQPVSYIVVGRLDQEIEALLPRLPEVFDKQDVIRALPYVPHRATLHRALESLLYVRQKIAVQTASRGRKTTQYRKVNAP